MKKSFALLLSLACLLAQISLSAQPAQPANTSFTIERTRETYDVQVDGRFVRIFERTIRWNECRHCA